MKRKSPASVLRSSSPPHHSTTLKQEPKIKQEFSEFDTVIPSDSDDERQDLPELDHNIQPKKKGKKGKKFLTSISSALELIDSINSKQEIVISTKLKKENDKEKALKQKEHLVEQKRKQRREKKDKINKQIQNAMKVRMQQEKLRKKERMEG